MVCDQERDGENFREGVGMISNIKMKGRLKF